MSKVHAVMNQVQHVCMPCMFLNTPLAFESTYCIWNWSSPPLPLFPGQGLNGGHFNFSPLTSKRWSRTSGCNSTYFIWLHLTFLAVFTELGYKLCEASSQFRLTPHPASTEVMWYLVISPSLIQACEAPWHFIHGVDLYLTMKLSSLRKCGVNKEIDQETSPCSVEFE